MVPTHAATLSASTSPEADPARDWRVSLRNAPGSWRRTRCLNKPPWPSGDRPETGAALGSDMSSWAMMPRSGRAFDGWPSTNVRCCEYPPIGSRSSRRLAASRRRGGVYLDEAWARRLSWGAAIAIAISLRAPVDKALVAGVRRTPRACHDDPDHGLRGEQARHVLECPGNLRRAETHRDAANRDAERFAERSGP